MTKSITVAGQTFNEFTANVNGATATFCALMDRTPARKNAQMFMQKSQYDGILGKLKQLPAADRTVLLQIEQIARTPANQRKGLTSPLEEMNRQQREAFDSRLSAADLSLCGNVLSVNYDSMKQNGAMRGTAVYNVSGRPIPATNMTPETIKSVEVSKQRLLNERAHGLAVFHNN